MSTTELNQRRDDTQQRAAQVRRIMGKVRWITAPKLNEHRQDSFTVVQARLAAAATLRFLEAYVDTGSLADAATEARKVQVTETDAPQTPQIGIERGIEIARTALGQKRNDTWWSSVAPKPQRKPSGPRSGKAGNPRSGNAKRTQNTVDASQRRRAARGAGAPKRHLTAVGD